MEKDNEDTWVLIVDDHAVLRESLRMILEDVPGIIVAGEAENGAEALEACRNNIYDVVLLDVRLPDRSGCEVARSLKSNGCPAGIIGLSMRDEVKVREQMLNAGADDFVSKAAGAENLIEAIRALKPPDGR